MPKRLNLLGQKFDRLSVIREDTVRAPDGRTKWICNCECGKQISIAGSYLINDNTKSCGCLRAELMSKVALTHGMTETSEYNTWTNIKGLCSNKNRKNYGAKGIKVCDRWLHSFQNFLEDVGMKPTPKHMLRRLNASGDYTPENCKWMVGGKDTSIKSTSNVNDYSTTRQTSRVMSEWTRLFGNINTSCDKASHYEETLN